MKSMIGRGLVFSLLVAAAYWVVFGTHGVREYFITKAYLAKKEQRIERIQQDIKTLKHELHAWKHDELKQEAVARYDFGLAFTNEVVYVVR